MPANSFHRRTALAWLALGAIAFGQIAEGSFEAGVAGGVVVPSPWTSVGSVLVFPSGGCTADAATGMPSAGAKWMRIASGGGAATTSSYAFTNHVAQTFTTGAAGTLLHLDVAFSTGEGPGSFFNDFLGVSVSNGVVTQTLLLLETATASFPGAACLTNQAATALTSIDVDLATILPGLTPTTPVTLRVHCANGGDNSVTSYAYVDNVYLGVPPPPPITVDFLPGGGGTWTFAVTSSMHPNARLYNLFSLVPATPTGTGPVFGIQFNADVLAQVVAPLGAHPFHVMLDGAGAYALGPIPIPAGLTVDTVSIVVEFGAVVEVSAAQNVVF